MIDLLGGADTVTWVAIFVKAIVYGTTLLGAGSVLVILGMPSLSHRDLGFLRRVAVTAAVVAAAFSLARLPLRASFLMGGNWAGASDPMMIGMVADSPLGTAVQVRVTGLVLMLALLLPWRMSRWLAGAGAFLACASFSLRGHALDEPRLLLGALVTVHLLGLAFWIGAFAPLYRVARYEDASVAGRLADDFGRVALWVVGALTTAGALIFALLTMGQASTIFGAYGQFFMLKIMLFSGLLCLAALNKLRLTPALMVGDLGATRRLRRSIAAEGVVVVFILLVTAALTTLSAP